MFDPCRQRFSSGAASETRALQPLRHHVEKGNDVTLDPGVDWRFALKRYVKFLAAILGNQGEADQRSAEAIIFGVQEVTNAASLDERAKPVQSPAATELDLRGERCISIVGR